MQLVRRAALLVALIVVVLSSGGQARAGLDLGFGNNGGRLFSSPAGPGSTMPWTTVVDAQGRILVCGFLGSNGFVARFTSSGAFDSSFGTNGFVSFPSQIPSIAVDPGNRILVGGQLGGALAVWRLNEDGSLDTSYGTTGVTTVPAGATLQRVTLDASSRVVAISTSSANFNVSVLRLLADGGLDSAFGTGGSINTGLTGPGDVVTLGNEVFVGGESGTDAAVRAYLAGGLPDSAFGSAGLATVDAGASDSVVGIALGPLGTIVVAGQSIAGNPLLGPPFVARFTSLGAPDASFGASGVAILPLPGSGGGLLQDVAVGPTGLIAVSGSHFDLGPQNSVTFGSLLAVISSTGTYDSSFVAGGLTLGTGSAGSAAVFQADGKLLVGGWVNGPSVSSGLLVRYVADPVPIITVPRSALVVEAEGASGARATFAVSASDLGGTSIPVTCLPASGSLFPLGRTIVSCSATDGAGNSASSSFAVRVVDTTAAVLSLSNVTAEAASASGAAVNYNATATDLVSGAVTPVCSRAAGSTFALGDTLVSCTATDGASNLASGSFTVHVVDTTGPALSLANVSVDATSPSGALVGYSATALDAVDGSVTPACAPPPGSAFVIGDTMVSCSATDAHHNTTSGTFNVHVRGATEQLAVLRALTTDARQLRKLDRVDTSLAAGKVAPACSALAQYADDEARTPGGNDLAARASRIGAVLGC